MGPAGQNKHVVAAQESCREIAACVCGVDKTKLNRHSERGSIKPPGSQPLGAHVDFNRFGTALREFQGHAQILIALGATSFRIFPYSLEYVRTRLQDKNNNGFYALSQADLRELREEWGSVEMTIPAAQGDVFVFCGGMVHAGPGVAADEPIRCTTYAQYWTVEDFHARESGGRQRQGKLALAPQPMGIGAATEPTVACKVALCLRSRRPKDEVVGIQELPGA